MFAFDLSSHVTSQKSIHFSAQIFCIKISVLLLFKHSLGVGGTSRLYSVLYNCPAYYVILQHII